MDLTAVAALMNLAGLGVVAYLLLTRMESRLSAIERAMNRLIVVQALEIVDNERNSHAVKTAAQQVIDDVRSERRAPQ